ncbi:MAG: hypothetical protein H7Y88_07260 [Phycisphaerales bacterium]|nr:hypothetical protein [Phycisphaerales bacterium]
MFQTSRRALSRTELLASIVLASALGAVVIASGARRVWPDESLNKLRIIGAATATYQADNYGYTPMVMSKNPRGFTPPNSGWCTWAFGGKNNNGPFWYPYAGGVFDVEAADRPLNAYTMPGTVFYAPPLPGRLPMNHSERLSAQAEIYRDPADNRTFQRNWPNPTPGVSCYDDIGTSYQTNMEWWSQNFQPGGFEAHFNEGTRRIATGEYLNPARFVWLTDQFQSIVNNNFSDGFTIVNDYGDTNMSVMLFLDGHSDYHTVFPGSDPEDYHTPDYDLRFVSREASRPATSPGSHMIAPPTSTRRPAR